MGGTIRWLFFYFGGHPMRCATVLIAAVFLAGCATSENYEKVLDTWVGSTEAELVSSWGPPNSFYESDGTRFLTYVRSRSGYIPGTAPTYQTTIIGNTAYTSSYGGSPGFSYSKHCKTTFTISGGTISTWRYEGNNCTALDPG